MKSIIDLLKEDNNISKDFKATFEFPATKTFEYEIDCGGDYSEQFDEDMCSSEIRSIEIPIDDVENAILDFLVRDYFNGSKSGKNFCDIVRNGLDYLITDLNMWDSLEEFYDEDLHDKFRFKLE